MENHREIRLNPAGLVEGAKTVISVALNYYPEQKLPPEAPHIAYYAYGKDYHLVVKEMLSELWTALFPRPARDRIETDGKGMDRNGLFFCDPASSVETRRLSLHSPIGLRVLDAERVAIVFVLFNFIMWARAWAATAVSNTTLDAIEI